MGDQILRNRIAFVTEGESGIGPMCVVAMTTAGAKVVVMNFKDVERGQAGATAARRLERKALAIQGDACDKSAVAADFDKAADLIGIPGILVDSAGNMSGVAVANTSKISSDRKPS